ncbi:MAG: hypothetical protein AAF657_14055 [Acidobacteriota bacterium]
MIPHYSRNRLIREHYCECGELQRRRVLRFTQRSLFLVADVELDESGGRAYFANYQPVPKPLAEHLDIEAHFSLAPVEPQTPPDVRAMVRLDIPSIAVTEDATHQLRRIMEAAK